MSRQRLWLFVAVLLAALALAGGSTQAQEPDQAPLSDEVRRMVHDVRQATRAYHDLDRALEAGYGIFQDCFTGDGTGDMGQHYVNGEFVGDDKLDPLTPEALVYEPQADGSLTLVALEYLVFEDQWTGDEPPRLFDHEFTLNTTIPETPPAWTLHLWLWTHNPNGMFAGYNPTVFCPEMG